MACLFTYSHAKHSPTSQSPHGTVGWAVRAAGCLFIKIFQKTGEEVELSAILGWSVELKIQQAKDIFIEI